MSGPTDFQHIEELVRVYSKIKSISDQVYMDNSQYRRVFEELSAPKNRKVIINAVNELVAMQELYKSL